MANKYFNVGCLVAKCCVAIYTFFGVKLQVENGAGVKKMTNIRNAWILGTPAFPKMDDFLKNFQKASDPPSLVSEMLRFFREVLEFATNFSDWSDQNFIAFPPQNYQKNLQPNFWDWKLSPPP